MALRVCAPTNKRCQLSIATGFLGAFVVASLAMQLLRSNATAPSAANAVVEPVTTHQATLWQTLGQP